ncbi:universal stress protein [Aquimarina celericrescens]|uniref:Universal stress protein n=1 Tax=Aquimarina celericrescens TaxID=1964542 RepID=A0ABW5AQI2_9FLAO|nr:universal stress protein [Aquimarina celericrescens]
MHTRNQDYKYRLLVLSDLSKSSETALKNAVQLAKVIRGRVEVLCVKSPADIADYENQFSAMRAIQEDSREVQTKLKNVVRKTEKEEGITIPFQISYGNIKQTIKEKIDELQPDLVLLGKRKSKLLNFSGHGITKFVLTKCAANVLISGEDHVFHSYTDISLGIFGDTLHSEGLEIINDLKLRGNNPLKFFSIRNRKKLEPSEAIDYDGKSAISYVFSEGVNALDGLASYVSKTNIELLCIPRRRKTSRSTFQLPSIGVPIDRVVQKLNVAILVLR